MSVTSLYLTVSYGSDLILNSQHQFGLSGQVLAAPLFMLQGDCDAAGQVVHAADDRRVSIRLQCPKMRERHFLRSFNFDIYIVNNTFTYSK